MSTFDYDYLVVGSGFGGSVSALRLTEKGYSVAVVERGRRWENGDFPATNWNLRKYLWAPSVGCHGIQSMTMLRDAMILHGSGVGGGSLVYGCVLLPPPRDVLQNPPWGQLGNWIDDLPPRLERARRMLGSTPTTRLGDTDHMLQEIAEEMGCGESFQPTEVGIFFDDSGTTIADPYFDGRGPDRAGCILCGGCLVGCRHNAKNTLDKNYLYLAESQGAKIIPRTEVRSISEHADGGYTVDAIQLGRLPFRRRRRFTVRGIVLSAGVMGTIPLLLRCKRDGLLPRISDQLGNRVCTNSESLVGATSRRSDVDFSKGIAIASGFRPDSDTSVEMVRYGHGQDLLSLISTILTEPNTRWPRALLFLFGIVRRPLAFLRLVNPFGWARRSGILLVMQSVPNHMSLRLRRRWYQPFTLKLDSYWHSGQEIPKYIPVAHEVAKRLAVKMDGTPSMSLPEAVSNVTSTAHILGGCCMSTDPSEGVVDKFGRVFGYENLYIADGSIVPGNLRVNPSLTITALAEWIMDHVPGKPKAILIGQRDAIGSKGEITQRAGLFHVF